MKRNMKNIKKDNISIVFNNNTYNLNMMEQQNQHNPQIQQNQHQRVDLLWYIFMMGVDMMGWDDW